MLARAFVPEISPAPIVTFCLECDGMGGCEVDCWSTFGGGHYTEAVTCGQCAGSGEWTLSDDEIDEIVLLPLWSFFRGGVQ